MINTCRWKELSLINILFLTNDELGHMESRGIFTDLLREFSAEGHNVYVVCANERKTKKETKLVIESNIHVLRVKTGNLTQVNMIEKGISTLMVGRQFKVAIKKFFSNVKFDLILYSTPPITLLSVIKFVKNRDGAKTYLMLKDIFPQNAVDIGIIKKNGMIYKYFRKVEKSFYNVSDYIGCMSHKNIEYFLEHNPEMSSKIVEICPNSIEPLSIEKNDVQTKEIRTKYGIPLDKTVFVYGGNIGKPQGIDFLIECLQMNRNNKDVYFLIIGSGTELSKLKRYFDDVKPSNATLLAKLPKLDYETLLISCDVGLIFLDRRFTIPNFPSRILSYMQASMPVLAATDINTDIGDVIVEGRFGYWCESGNVQEFTRNVNKLCNANKRMQLGRNSRKYLEDNYTSKRSYEIIMSHFR